MPDFLKSMNHRDTEGHRDSLSEIVIGSAIEVHRHLGAGLLESAYEECLCWELQQRGVPVQRQHPLPVNYKGQQLDCGYRIDLLVANRLVVELKAVEQLLPIHEAQILSYLRLGGFDTGLLVNFHTTLLKNGIRRFKL
ncbi:GxxExxY protein [Chitinilyticum litopenaei]|uniref:GxxExxY protein n=1 Tax=Chitinilyticum litopenaei TaxID=1121276 RepID=UPI0009DB914B|nr:GxxExxY protein [Chitinilyticum litopenaei]